MDDKQFKILRKDIGDLKKLLALLLKHFEVKNRAISEILDISPGRLSQMAPKMKYKKKGNKDG